MALNGAWHREYQPARRSQGQVQDLDPVAAGQQSNSQDHYKVSWWGGAYSASSMARSVKPAQSLLLESSSFASTRPRRLQTRRTIAGPSSSALFTSSQPAQTVSAAGRGRAHFAEERASPLRRFGVASYKPWKPPICRQPMRDFLTCVEQLSRKDFLAIGQVGGAAFPFRQQVIN